MQQSSAHRRSIPGVYTGLSEIVADGYWKFSQYVTMRDGCRLAVDVYRPTLKGEFLTEAIPSVVTSTGYRRSFELKRGEMWRDLHFPQFEYGDVVSWVTRAARIVDRHRSQWLEPIEGLSRDEFRNRLIAKGATREFLLMHGYNIVMVDNRSTGSSFGKCDQLDHQTQGLDLGDIFAWLAQQPWSTDRIGMIGNSWNALAQNAAISCNPKYLRAVMPITGGADTFIPMYPGGLYNVGLMRQWYHERYEQELGGYEADVVDDDPQGTLRAAAIADRVPPPDAKDLPWILAIPRPEQREAMLDYYADWSRDRYEQNSRYLNRDLPDGTRGNWKMGHLDPSLANKSQIAHYTVGGFWDLLAYDTPMCFAALSVPRKLLIGPWNHASWIGSEVEETLRWMDYHLKGIDNGIMREPPVTYSLSHPSSSLRWFAADQFPPSGVTTRSVHVSSSSTQTPLIGVLSSDRPTLPSDDLQLRVDYDTTSGLASRQWGYALGLHLNLERLERFRDRVLTIVTPPLREDLEITGHPIFDGHLTTSGTAGALFAFLQDIAPDREAHYLTDGQLNFRDRKLSQPAFENLGLPYQSIRECDRLPVVPGEVMHLRFALNPVAWVVPAGHRLCLTLTGADLDNFHQVRLQPPPVLTVLCGTERGTRLELPVVGDADSRGATEIPDAFAHMREPVQKACESRALDAATLAVIQTVVP
jgi:putative CocE/NonD family hydrolase